MEPIPETIDELYKIIVKLEKRITNLETENSYLKQNKRITKQISDINILNEPDLTLSEWIKQIVIPEVPNFLEIVFKNDLLTGIQNLLTLCIENTKEMPLVSFENKTRDLYIYDNNNDTKQWFKITGSQFQKYLTIIIRRFAIDFNQYWFVQNQDNINNNEYYTDLYIDYYQKILGGNDCNSDKICSKLQKYIYNKIKKKI